MPCAAGDGERMTLGGEGQIVSGLVVQVNRDSVVVDIGGTTADGYCSDSTRMYCVGAPPEDFRAYFEVLHRARDLLARERAQP